MKIPGLQFLKSQLNTNGNTSSNRTEVPEPKLTFLEQMRQPRKTSIFSPRVAAGIELAFLTLAATTFTIGAMTGSGGLVFLGIVALATPFLISSFYSRSIY